MKNEGDDRTFLSFIDIMFCGFGAVVLLVMILNGKTLQKRDDKQMDQRSEVEQLTEERQSAEASLAELQARNDEMRLQEGELRRQADKLRQQIAEASPATPQQTEQAREDNLRQAREIARLQSQKADLEREARQRRQSQISLGQSQGQRQIGFDSDGRRQYLTGLKLGGDRTLILVDASASMLDETVVNVVRRKLMHESVRRQAPKWQRVVRSVHWLVANLQPDKRFQVYYFNTDVYPAIPGSDRRWLDSDDTEQLRAAIDGIQQVAPLNGTNLDKAFQVISALDPRPDSVVLVTDGLPTQGLRSRSAASITGQDRRQLFNDAVRRLPSGVPINILLYPIEGDPGAAEAFWGLAISSNGSFITPSRDWP